MSIGDELADDILRLGDPHGDRLARYARAWGTLMLEDRDAPQLAYKLASHSAETLVAVWGILQQAEPGTTAAATAQELYSRTRRLALDLVALADAIAGESGDFR